MSKKLKFFFAVSYIIILVTFLYFIFSQVEISKLNDFSYYKEIQITLENYIGSDLFFNLVLSLFHLPLRSIKKSVQILKIYHLNFGK